MFRIFLNIVRCMDDRSRQNCDVGSAYSVFYRSVICHAAIVLLSLNIND